MAKNIIVCCDGTGQQFQRNTTNPLRLYYCLDHSASQIAFYDPGVGTAGWKGPQYTAGELKNLAATAWRTIQGQGRGVGIIRNIEDAYRYLMQVYHPGDRVYLFGFSRGAFTAQAIAGMLAKCGLLHAHNDNLIPYATKIYLTRDNTAIARQFKATMARPCTPKMLGVWETVKSLGSSYAEDFFYNHTAINCETGYHALAIDEKRTDFQPQRWPADAANLHPVWFAGSHADIGGGYPEDGLANCALRWMIEQAQYHGVQFNDQRVNEFQPDYTGQLHASGTGLWRLRGTKSRDIPKDATIHPSAIKRYQQSIDGYAPPNWPSKKVD